MGHWLSRWAFGIEAYGSYKEFKHIRVSGLGLRDRNKGIGAWASLWGVQLRAELEQDSHLHKVGFVLWSIRTLYVKIDGSLRKLAYVRMRGLLPIYLQQRSTPRTKTSLSNFAEVVDVDYCAVAMKEYWVEVYWVSTRKLIFVLRLVRQASFLCQSERKAHNFPLRVQIPK